MSTPKENEERKKFQNNTQRRPFCSLLSSLPLFFLVFFSHQLFVAFLLLLFLTVHKGRFSHFLRCCCCCCLCQQPFFALHLFVLGWSSCSNRGKKKRRMRERERERECKKARGYTKAKKGLTPPPKSIRVIFITAVHNYINYSCIKVWLESDLDRSFRESDATCT